MRRHTIGRDAPVKAETITQEYCRGKNLLFYPKSESEAAFIQQSLFNLGLSWGSRRKDTLYLKESVQKGLVLNDKLGGLYLSSGQADRAIGTICSSAQFDPPFDTNTPEHRERLVREYGTEKEMMILLLDKFNSMAERIDTLSAQVEKLNAEIAPTHLQKDAFKPKQ
jgi:hypothetical protein